METYAGKMSCHINCKCYCCYFVDEKSSRLDGEIKKWICSVNEMWLDSEGNNWKAPSTTMALN